MKPALPTASVAYGLNGPSATAIVDNATPAGLHLSSGKNCPNKRDRLSCGAILLGFQGIDLGIIMLMGAAPSAAASYVMARAMGGNGALAANIVAITSLGSLGTTTVAITVLRFYGLM